MPRKARIDAPGALGCIFRTIHVQADIQNIHLINILMELVEAGIKTDPAEKGEENSKANGHPQQVDQAHHFVSPEVPDGYQKIILNHCIMFTHLYVKSVP